MASAGKKATIKVSGTAISMTDEAMTVAGNGLSAQITNTAKRVLTRTGAYTVEADATPITDYTLNRLTGTVTFDQDRTGEVITISGDYLPIAAVSEAHQYSWSVENNWLEDTTFEEAIDNGGYIQRDTNGLKSASGTVGMFYNTDTTLVDAITDDVVVVLEFTINSIVDARAWARLETVDFSSDVAATNDASMAWLGETDNDGNVFAFL